MLQLKASAIAFSSFSRQVSPLTKNLLAHVGGGTTTSSANAVASSSNNAASSIITSIATRAGAHAGSGGSSSSGSGANANGAFQAKYAYSLYNNTGTSASLNSSSSLEDDESQRKLRSGLRTLKDTHASRHIRDRFYRAEQLTPLQLYENILTPPTPSDGELAECNSKTITTASFTGDSSFDSHFEKFKDLQLQSDVEGAKLEFQKIRQNGTNISAESYRILIDVLSRARHGPNPLADMLAAYASMVESNIVPDANTYSTLIKALCERDQAVEQRKQRLLQRKKTLETNSQNVSDVAVEATHDIQVQYVELDHEVNFENAMSLFRNSGRKFDVSVYTALLASCVMHGNMSDAVFVFNAIKESRPQNAESDAYSDLIGAYAAASDMTGAMNALNEYANQEMASSQSAVIAQNALIQSFFQIGDVGAAIAVFERMMSQNKIRFDSETIDNIINGFLVINDAETALRWLEKITSFPGIPQPHSKTCESLLSQLSKQGKFAMATQVLNLLMMLSNESEAPDYESLHDYFSLSIESGRPEYAVQLAIAIQGRFGMHFNIEHAGYLIKHMLEKDAISSALSLYIVALQGWKSTGAIETMNSGILAGIASDIISHSRATFIDTFLPLLPHLRHIAPALNGAKIVELYFKDRNSTKEMLLTMQDTTMLPLLSDLYLLMISHQMQISTSELTPGERQDIYYGLVALIADMNMDMSLPLPDDLMHKIAFFIQTLELPNELSHFLEEMQTQYGSTPPSELVSDVASSAEASLLEDSLSLPKQVPIIIQEPLPPMSIDAHMKPQIDVKESKVVNESLHRGNIEYALRALDNVEKKGRWMAPDVAVNMISSLSKTKEHLRVAERVYHHIQACVPYIEVASLRQQYWAIALNAMITAHGTNGNLEFGRYLIGQLRAMGKTPSADAMASFVIGLGSTSGQVALTDHGAITDEATEAMKIYQEAKELGVQLTIFFFNTVMSKLSKARRTDQVLELFDELTAMGLRPNSITYGTLINACCRVGDEFSAKTFFSAMEADDSFVPRVPPYNTLMQYYTTTKPNRETALYYYEALRSKGLKPTAHTYKLLIDAYSLDLEHMDDARQVLDEIRKDGGQVTNSHYAALVHAYGCVQRDVDLALKTFESIYKEPIVPKVNGIGRERRKEIGRLMPDELAYQALLETFISNNRMNDAQVYIQRMSHEGVQITPYIANLFIRGYSNAGDLESAKRVFYKEMMDVDDAAYMRRDRRNVHVQPIREPSTYEAMVRAYLSFGLRNEAQEVVRLMETKAFPFAVVGRVRGLLDGGDGFSYSGSLRVGR